MSMDPLSDVLELVRARCGMAGSLIAGGAWSRRFAYLDAIKLCAATAGECWYFMDGMVAPAPFSAGDVIVTNGRRSLILASEPDLVGTAITTAITREKDGTSKIGDGTCSFAMLGGKVDIDERRQPLLLGGLPPLILVKGNTVEAAPIAWLLQQLLDEMTQHRRVGYSVVVAELTQLLFVQVLRLHLEQRHIERHGWLKGLGDERLAPALQRMHEDPARNWSLADLAKEAGMSRTSFAVRFRDVMGVPPLTYLFNWRMNLAKRDLDAGASVGAVANAIGYTSESAFNNAFKRTTGIAPGRYRRAASIHDTPGTVAAGMEHVDIF